MDPIFPLPKVFPAAAFRAELILSTYVRIGPAMFLSSFSPRSMNSSFRQSRTWRSAPSERQMPPGSAMPSGLPLDQPILASRTGASGCLQVRIDLRWRERPRQCFGWGHCRGLLRVAGGIRQVHRTAARVNGILPTRQRRRAHRRIQCRNQYSIDEKGGPSIIGDAPDQCHPNNTADKDSSRSVGYYNSTLPQRLRQPPHHNMRVDELSG